MKKNSMSLEQFRLTKKEMTLIKGGYDPIICNALQALANNDTVTQNWTDKDWEAWAERFNQHCLDMPMQPQP